MMFFPVVQVQPTFDDGAPWEQYPPSDFVRTGLLGFLGPVRFSLLSYFLGSKLILLALKLPQCKASTKLIL